MGLGFSQVYELLLSEGPYKVYELFSERPYKVKEYINTSTEDSRIAGLGALVHYWEESFTVGDQWLSLSERLQAGNVYVLLAKAVKEFIRDENQPAAQQMLDQALIMEPANDLCLMLKAYYSEGDEGRRGLEGLTRRYPRNAELWNKLGALHLMNGDLGGSLVAFEKVCELHPEVATGFLNVGVVRATRCFSFQSLDSLQDLELAKIALEKAIKLEPDNQDFPPLLFLAQVEWGLGNHQKAKKVLSSFLEKNPLNYDALALMIVLQVETNQVEVAAELFAHLKQIHTAKKPRENGATTVLGLMFDQRRLAQIIAEARSGDSWSATVSEDTLEAEVQLHFVNKLQSSFQDKEKFLSRYNVFAERDKSTAYRGGFGRLYQVTTGFYGYCYLCFTSAAMYIVQMGEFTSRKDPYASKSLKQEIGEFAKRVSGELNEMVSFSGDFIFRYPYRDIMGAEMRSKNWIKIVTAVSTWELFVSPESVKPILDAIHLGRDSG